MAPSKEGEGILNFEIKFKPSKLQDGERQRKNKPREKEAIPPEDASKTSSMMTCPRRRGSGPQKNCDQEAPPPFLNLVVKTSDSKDPKRRSEKGVVASESLRRIGKERRQRPEKAERRSAHERPARSPIRQKSPSARHRRPSVGRQRGQDQISQRGKDQQPPQRIKQHPVHANAQRPRQLLDHNGKSRSRLVDEDPRFHRGDDRRTMKKTNMHKPNSEGRLLEMARAAPRLHDKGRRSSLRRLIPEKERHAPHPEDRLGPHHSRRRIPPSSTTSRPATNIFNGAINGAMEKILSDNSPAAANTVKENDMESRIAEMLYGKLMDSNFNPGLIADNVPGTANSSTSSSSGPPQGDATIVLTDVQGSTSLWEADPQAMQSALDLHDKILRKNCAAVNGYEIDTEGDAFFLAFHTPSDAFSFALKAQLELYKAEWSDDILKIPAAAEECSFRGLRVRMGIHQGAVNSCKNEVTGRTEYVGEAMNIAKCVEGMTHGGQILTTFETWNAASNQGGSNLESPQVVDLGCHVLKPKGCDEPVERRILQLVPESLAFDYFAARRNTNDADGTTNESSTSGRQFDSPITEEQVTASFHDAPHENHEVTIAFVYFSEIENQYENPKPIISDLIRLVGDLLVGTPGYHSQSNMLAFPDIAEAVDFGTTLLDELKEKRLNNADLSDLVKFGCVHDTFITMGPHKTTGRADYFGKVVNRAARITAKSELGTVNFGVLADTNVKDLPKLKDKYTYRFKGVKELKGVQEDMALYEVSLSTKGNIPLGLTKKR